jgi:ribosome-associated protein
MTLRGYADRSSPSSLRQRIPEASLTFRFSTSPGPGGQNVNKLNTRVTLWFDLEGCPRLTRGEKERIRLRLGRRISATGRLRIVSSRFRTQASNRRAAVERFYDLLADALRPRKVRKATGPTASSVRRRLAEKRQVGQKKLDRSAARRALD